MTVRIGINGFGRMGRLVLRAGWQSSELSFVHVNETKGGVGAAAHLLKFDSVHGRWPLALKEIVPRFEKSTCAKVTLVFGTSRALRVRLDAPGPPAQGDFDLEVEIPPLVHEILGLARDRRWQLSVHRGAIRMLPA